MCQKDYKQSVCFSQHSICMSTCSFIAKKKESYFLNGNTLTINLEIWVEKQLYFCTCNDDKSPSTFTPKVDKQFENKIWFLHLPNKI